MSDERKNTAGKDAAGPDGTAEQPSSSGGKRWSARRKAAVAAVAAVAVAACAVGAAAASGAFVGDREAEPEVVREESARASYSVVMSSSLWSEESDALGLVVVKGEDGEQVAAKRVELNSERIICDLENGEYTVSFYAPVLADGTMYKAIEDELLTVDCGAGECQHGEDGHGIETRIELEAVAVEDMTADLVEEAVLPFAEEWPADAESMREAATSKMEQHKKAQEEATAEEAGAAEAEAGQGPSGGAAPSQGGPAGGWEQTGPAGGGSSGGSTAPQPGGGGGGGSTSGGGGGGSTSGGGTGSGGEEPPPPSKVTIYYCSCGFTSQEQGAVAAHRQSYRELANANRDPSIYDPHSSEGSYETY